MVTHALMATHEATVQNKGNGLLSLASEVITDDGSDIA